MPARIDWGRILGVAGLLLLSWAYCLPGHPSAGRLPGLDAVLHVGLFAVVGVCWTRLAGRDLLATVLLFALAALLEVLQWWRGGYATPEYIDMACNVLGALLGRSFAARAAQISRKDD